MKEIVLQFVAYLPEYVKDLLKVMISPKRFNRDMMLNQEYDYRKAILFLCLSTALVLLLEWPVIKAVSNEWITVGIFFVLCLLSVLSFALMVWLAWLSVGGKAPINAVFVTSSYFSGALMVIFVPFLLLGLGMMKVIEPTIYYELYVKHSALPLDMLFGSKGYVVFIYFMLSGLLVDFLWFFIAWGSYRELVNATKVRSAAAFAIFNIMFVLLTAMFLVIGTIYFG